MQTVSHKHYILVEALLYIALNASLQPIGRKKLAHTLNVTPRYLEALLQLLVKADILRSIRGPRGGYMIARERRSVTIADIWNAIDDAEVAPSDNISTLSAGNTQLIQPIFANAQRAYVQQLARYTLEDVCERVYSLDMQHTYVFSHSNDDTTRLDFSI